MIRAGRKVVDNLDIARMAGFGTLRSAQRARLFERPDMPAAVTRGKSKKLWDAEQIVAWLKGDPIPQLPDEDHPDDLLDSGEAAELLGITEVAWRRYDAIDRNREWDDAEQFLLPPVAEDTPPGTRYRRRGDIVSFVRPGVAAGAGRPKNSSDQRPRASRSRAARAQREAHVEQMLQDADPDEPVTARRVADELGIQMRLAQRTLQLVTVKRMLKQTPGERVTASHVARALGISAQNAQRLLDQVTEEDS